MSKKKRRAHGSRQSHKSACHTGLVEVVSGLFCGAENDVIASIRAGAHLDVLVPLNSLCGSIWDMGFRGEILYYPIKDFSVLPEDVLEDAVSKVITRLKAGKKVAVFCMGGHGRTGYLSSIVLGRLGTDDPIGSLREKYCENAVESTNQVEHIAETLQKPELVEKYAAQNMALSQYDWNELLSYFPAMNMHDEVYDSLTCGACVYYHDDSCSFLEAHTRSGNPACWDFEEATDYA